MIWWLMDTHNVYWLCYQPENDNSPSSDKTDHGEVIIPYLKNISKKFQSIGNHFKGWDNFKS